MNRKKELKMNVLGECSVGKGCFFGFKKGENLIYRIRVHFNLN